MVRDSGCMTTKKTAQSVLIEEMMADNGGRPRNDRTKAMVWGVFRTIEQGERTEWEGVESESSSGLPVK